MDIYDMKLEFHISLKKLRRMEKAGVLRVGKSKMPKHWQMVRSDIKKGKMSARSIALAYRYPRELDKVMEMSSRQREVVRNHFLKADLPAVAPRAYDGDLMVGVITAGASGNEEPYLNKFICQMHEIIPERPVDHNYVAVRILLAAPNEVDICNTSYFLRRALLNAKDSPTMKGWWHREPTGSRKGYRTIYHRPSFDFDL